MTPTTGRRAVDWSVYLITDTVMCGEAGVVSTVTAAIRGGVSVVQLRDSVCEDREFVALGVELVEALAPTGIPLLINDRAHLVTPIGADGLHIGQGDIGAAEARALIGPERLLGLSVQTRDQLDHALPLREDLDYLGVGPVWAQSTKPDAAPPCGTDLLTHIASASPWPCVAIGGIDAARVAQVRESGAAGVAVVSAICGTADPSQAAAGLRRAWENAWKKEGSQR